MKRLIFYINEILILATKRTFKINIYLKKYSSLVTIYMHIGGGSTLLFRGLPST